MHTIELKPIELALEQLIAGRFIAELCSLLSPGIGKAKKIAMKKLKC